MNFAKFLKTPIYLRTITFAWSVKQPISNDLRKENSRDYGLNG